MPQKKTKKTTPKPAKKRVRNKTESILEQLAPDDRQALVQVGTLPGCTLKAVIMAAGCSKGAAQRTVKKLMEMGLVRRDEKSRPFAHYCTTQGYKIRERVCAEA